MNQKESFSLPVTFTKPFGAWTQSTQLEYNNSNNNGNNINLTNSKITIQNFENAGTVYWWAVGF